MNDPIILHGAGTTGRFVCRDMIATGKRPVCFVDNDVNKQGTLIEGISVLSPDDAVAFHPAAEWICTIMDPKQMGEVLEQVKALGVKTSSFWDFIPNRDSEIPIQALATIWELAGDQATRDVLMDQVDFRKHRDHTKQLTPYPLEDLYFPEFYTRLDSESFVDCGGADGDTVKEFVKRWPKWRYIVAFEPDKMNFHKLLMTSPTGVDCRNVGVSDRKGQVSFIQTGDYSAHIDGSPITDENVDESAYMITLDEAKFTYSPTLIKMDVEGSELAALWGARRIIKEHKPILAICAYHTADHLWEIPLLIHALQPEYKLFLRHYRPGTWETVWYAVPPNRMVK